jgi:hypothetical protein
MSTDGSKDRYFARKTSPLHFFLHSSERDVAISPGSDARHFPPISSSALLFRAYREATPLKNRARRPRECLFFHRPLASPTSSATTRLRRVLKKRRFCHMLSKTQSNEAATRPQQVREKFQQVPDLFQRIRDLFRPAPSAASPSLFFRVFNVIGAFRGNPKATLCPLPRGKNGGPGHPRRKNLSNPGAQMYSFLNFV